MEDEGGVFAGDESHQNSDKIHLAEAEEHSDSNSWRKREVSESRQQHLGCVVQRCSGHSNLGYVSHLCSSWTQPNENFIPYFAHNCFGILQYCFPMYFSKARGPRGFCFGIRSLLCEKQHLPPIYYFI